MGAVTGLLFASGLLLLLAPPAAETTTARRSSLADLIARSGTAGITPAGLLGAAAACSVLAGAGAFLVTAIPAVAIAAALAAAAGPVIVLRRRARRRDKALRTAWPDAIDVLVSGVRAGLSLPEALADLGSRGPGPLRPAFADFAADFRAAGSFADSLDALQSRLADPVADRVVMSLRLARDVGGTDLGRVLRSLAEMVRLDARTRGEIEARQSWTVNAARLAVAAPWLTLALLATRPAAIDAYNSPAGLVVLIGCAAASIAAYRIMLRIGRLPVEQRIVR
ncbi:MAG: type II secretion system protein F [Actinomycetota bacterium]|nr:MAG: type II secretion system protein F [Actinomycetota bacterium]